MAPESIRGEPVTEAADFYAVGVILFEALTGRWPFESSHFMKVLTRKLEEPAPSASALVKGIPSDLDHLCAALLDRDPARRPGVAAILAVLGAPAPPGGS